MLGPAIVAIKPVVEAANLHGWPLRWPNSPWQGADHVHKDDYPVDANGDPVPFVEAQVIGGTNELRAFSRPGNRLFIHPGLIRVYLAVPSGTGDDLVQSVGDVFAAALERIEIPAPATPRIVRTMDCSVHRGVASVPKGNHFVLMCSVPFEFYYEH